MIKKGLAAILTLGLFWAFAFPALAKGVSPAGAAESEPAAHGGANEISVGLDRKVGAGSAPAAAAAAEPPGSASVAAYYGGTLGVPGPDGNPAAIYAALAANAVQPAPGTYPVPDFTPVSGAPYTGRRQPGVAPADAETVQAVQSAMEQAFGAFLSDHPEVFWLDKVTVRMDANPDYSRITGISLVVDDSSLTGEYQSSGWTGVQLDQTRLSTALGVFLNALAPGEGADRADWLRAAHDKLVREVRYDTAAAGELLSGAPIQNARPFGVTGALLDHRAVCDGYAKALQMLCGALDIPCLYVAGQGDNGKLSGPHAWNYVQLEDGNWYAIDTTWDDLDAADTVSHRYFLVGTSLSSDHFAYSGLAGALPALSPTNYPQDNPLEGPADPVTYYQVKTDYDDEQGAVAVMPPRVTSGGSVEVIILPYKGYQVQAVTVDDWPQDLPAEGGLFTLDNISKTTRLAVDFAPLAVAGPTAMVVPPGGDLNIWELRSDLDDPTSSGLLLLATQPFNLPAALLGAAQNAKKPVEAVFRDGEQVVQYSWTFEGAAIVSPEIEVNLGLTVAPLRENASLRALAGRDDGLVVSFAHGGMLPGPATVSVRVAPAYANGQSVNCYEYDPVGKRFVIVAQNRVVQNGAVTFPLTHCADILVTGAPIVGAALPDSGAPKPPGPAVPNPATGDSLPGSAPIFLGAAALALAIRKKISG